MSANFRRLVLLPLTLAFLGVASVFGEEQAAEQPDHPQLVKTTLADGIDRIAGQEPTSRIQYVRLAVPGSLRLPVTGDSPAPSPSPTLIAQCTLRPNGKSYFELFANFGRAPNLAFYPPWTRTPEGDLFPPPTEKVIMTMDFLGYTHVKPVRRQWEIPVQTPGQYRYNPPGSGSSNLEEIAYYLRYLLALPTLRLTLGNNSADFLTTPLLNEIRKEPLCRAAAL
ncbi:hypothetical protein [Tunturiibacter gelidoferens]|jgi:hypothetical protein|uniref:Uncharacterized protein n=1 Tax=Tunturiibacter gelidiferens TaxID=3069689 RepID=A0A9X0QB23_9BACT|nr:hypothetical protein [Edaphobacter lichenicola]MBB5326930.1 hypothetical protein [Edaphobacter lichenicola]